LRRAASYAKKDRLKRRSHIRFLARLLFAFTRQALCFARYAARGSFDQSDDLLAELRVFNSEKRPEQAQRLFAVFFPQNEQQRSFSSGVRFCAPAELGRDWAASILADRIFQLSYPNAFAISSSDSL
jgi:hypothetical protein